MIKAIWIDIDNTLLDFDAYVQMAMKEGFARFGLGEYTEETYRIFEGINSTFWHKIETAEITYEELLRDRWNTVFAALGISFDGPTFEKYFKSYLTDSAIPVAGSVALLEHLKGRYLLCVASNGPYDQQMNRLRLGNLLPYFSHFFISGKIGISKPAKGFFSYGIDEMNREREEKILPEEILMIGDSLTSDMAGASKFGMHTCWLDRSGNGNTKGLQIDYVVRSLAQIHDFL